MVRHLIRAGIFDLHYLPDLPYGAGITSSYNCALIVMIAVVVMVAVASIAVDLSAMSVTMHSVHGSIKGNMCA